MHENLNLNRNYPEWSIHPKTLKEVIGEGGKETFEVIHSPENGIWPIENVGFSQSLQKVSLTQEAADTANKLIYDKERALAADHMARLKEWQEKGENGEMPMPTTFFNGDLVRSLPEEIQIAKNSEGEEIVVIPLGNTKYYDYVVTRNLNFKTDPHSSMALPLAMCGVLTAYDSKGENYLIYTVRTTKPETYQGSFHVVGGMLSKPETGIAHPTQAWIQELSEEAGLNEDEINMHGTLGIVMDTHWTHMEVTHKANLNIFLDEAFQKDGCNLTPKRPTDKEVNLRAIPWKADLVSALIFGKKIKDGDEDLRPWVPTGLANILLAGKIDFGEEWYNKTLRGYRDMLLALK